MAIHHELQTVRVRCERVDVTIHRQAHPIQSLNDHIRRTTIHNSKIRKLNSLISQQISREKEKQNRNKIDVST